MAKKSPTPTEIVAEWHEQIEKELKPWFLQPKCFTHFEPKLRKNIADLVKNGAVFRPQDMKNSRRVAKDAAKICKILQPAPHPKEVRFDTFQVVLKLCAKHHQVCRSGAPRGAGGWCDV